MKYYFTHYYLQPSDFIFKSSVLPWANDKLTFFNEPPVQIEALKYQQSVVAFVHVLNNTVSSSSSDCLLPCRPQLITVPGKFSFR